MSLNKMLEELGGGSLGVSTDGTWTWAMTAGFGRSYTGNTPEQAIRAAWQAEVQQA